jgi:hypothetical membrane protein
MDESLVELSNLTNEVYKKQKILAICGVVAPIIFFIMVAIESMIRPGYSPFHNFVSDLGVGPLSILQNVNFMIFGILTIGLGLGLHGGLPKPMSRFLKSGIWLVVIFGVLIFFAGVFPEDYGTGVLHTIVSAFGFLTIIAAQLCVWRGLRGNEIWRGYRTYSLISGLLSIIFLILLQISISNFAAYQGLAQRLFLAVPWIWIGITGLKLYFYIKTNEKNIPNE